LSLLKLKAARFTAVGQSPSSISIFHLLESSDSDDEVIGSMRLGNASVEEDFLRRQAERVRSLALIADPFTKQRLLILAERYDDRLRGVVRASSISVSPQSENRKLSR
jgi:hypothetical protein